MATRIVRRPAPVWAALVLVGTALAGAGCESDSPAEPSSGAPRPMSTPARLIDTSVTFVRFEHVVGETECPQRAGRFQVRNMASESVSVKFSSAHGALAIDPVEATLGPGETREFLVVFNCSTTDSFSADIQVEARGGGATETGTLRVEGTLRR